MTHEHNFTQGKIMAPLMKFALPVMLAMFLQALYGAVDLIIVGQFSDAVNVSAVSTGSQIIMTITLVVTGLSMGVTILTGQKIGEGRPEVAGHVVGSGIHLFILIGMLLTVIMVPGAGAVSALMQAPAEAFTETVQYVRISSAGFLFITAYNVLGSIFRGIGDSKMPLITVAIATVINIIGDLVFVAALHWGAGGAALATVIAQAVSVLLSFMIIRKRKLPFVMTKKDISFDRLNTAWILKLGIPVALQDLLVNISFLVILAIVNSMGVVYSAGLGVAEKLCMFIMLIPSSYMQSMSAFVAQNIGAEKPDRARKALLCGIGTSVIAGICMFWLGFFHGDLLSMIFTKDAGIVVQAFDYLKAYAIDALLTSFLFCFIGYFNGCGRTLFVMIQGLVGAFLVRIPVSYFMSLTDDPTLFKIGLATPCSTIVQIVLCAGFFIILLRKEKRGTPIEPEASENGNN